MELIKVRDEKMVDRVKHAKLVREGYAFILESKADAQRQLADALNLGPDFTKRERNRMYEDAHRLDLRADQLRSSLIEYAGVQYVTDGLIVYRLTQKQGGTQ